MLPRSSSFGAADSLITSGGTVKLHLNLYITFEPDRQPDGILHRADTAQSKPFNVTVASYVTHIGETDMQAD